MFAASRAAQFAEKRPVLLGANKDDHLVVLDILLKKGANKELAMKVSIAYLNTSSIA